MGGSRKTEKAPVAPEDVMRAEREKKKAEKKLKKVSFSLFHCRDPLDVHVHFRTTDWHADWVWIMRFLWSYSRYPLLTRCGGPFPLQELKKAKKEAKRAKKEKKRMEREKGHKGQGEKDSSSSSDSESDSEGEGKGASKAQDAQKAANEKSTQRPRYGGLFSFVWGLGVPLASLVCAYAYTSEAS